MTSDMLRVASKAQQQNFQLQKYDYSYDVTLTFRRIIEYRCCALSH